MPRYRIRLSDGRVVTVEAAQPPTEADVLQAVGAAQGGGAGPVGTQAPPGRGPGQGGGPGAPGPPSADWSDIGPMIGGTIGSVLGGIGGGAVGGPGGAYVGATLGAGAGGALGQGAQDLVRGRPPTVEDMAAAGLVQGVGEAGGRAIGAGTGLVGKGLYKGGVALLPRSLKAQYPNIAKTGLRERIPLTRRGADRADVKAAVSGKKARTEIAIAEATGAPPIQPREVLREMPAVGSRMRAQADLGRASELPGLVQRARTFQRRHAGGIPLTRAQELKEEAQDLAIQAYRARDRGGVINNNELLADEAMGRGLRGALEDRVPGLGAINRETQDLIGLREGAKHASETGHILSRLGGAGAGALLAGSGGGLLPAVAAAGGGLALTTPGGLTSTGLFLNRLAPMVAQSPNAARLAAILSALAEENPEGAEQ